MADLQHENGLHPQHANVGGEKTSTKPIRTNFLVGTPRDARKRRRLSPRLARHKSLHAHPVQSGPFKLCRGRRFQTRWALSGNRPCEYRQQQRNHLWTHLAELGGLW
jgi:hypothetical protein